MGKRLNIVKGNSVDSESRCSHYHSDLDVIAIKFKCCKEYYACYYCHQELSGHDAQVWGQDEFDEKAVLCGVCGNEMTIAQYLKSNFRCLKCGAPYNPKCIEHYHLYFDIK